MARTGVGLAGVGAVFGAASRALADSGRTGQRHVVLQLPWYHSWEYAGYYAAEHQGFFKRAGLKVEIRAIEHPITAVEAVVSGAADYGVSSSAADILQHRLRGKPVVVLATIFQRSGFCLRTLSAPDGPAELAALRGKIVGLHPRPHFHAELEMMLRAAGAPPGSYRLAPEGWRSADLLSGAVDAVAGSTINTPVAFRSVSHAIRVWQPYRFGVDFCGDTLFTREDVIREHPEEVEAFRRAVVDGWAHALARPKELAELILREYPAPPERPHSLESLLQQVSAVRELTIVDMVDLGYVNRERWSRMAMAFNELERIRLSREDLDRRVSTMFFEPPDPRQALKAALISGGIAAGIAAGAIGWSVQLRRAVRARTAALETRNREMDLAQKSLAAAEARAVESEQRSRSMFDHSPQPMWVYAPSAASSTASSAAPSAGPSAGASAVAAEGGQRGGQRGGRILDVNGAALVQYGYSREQFLSLDASQLDAGRLDHQAAAALGTTAPRSSTTDATPLTPAAVRGGWSGIWTLPEHRDGPRRETVTRKQRRADGSVFDAEIRSEVLPSLGAGARLVLVTDVTERLAAQAALKASEERFQLAVRGTQDGVWDWDIIRNVTYASERFSELLGYAPGELQGSGELLWDSLHPEDREHVQAALMAHLDRDERYDVEYRLRTRTGEFKWFRSRGRATRGEGGYPVRMAGSITDIGERKAAEAERLELSRQREAALARLELIMTRLPIGCIVWDEELRIAFANPGAQRMFGYTAEELIGRELSDLIASDIARATVADRTAKLRAGTDQASGVNENVRKDGTIISVEWFNTPLRDPQGRHLGILSMCVDVTERVAAEATIRENEQRLRLALEASRSGSWEWDVATGRVAWSPEFRKMLGLTASQENRSGANGIGANATGEIGTGESGMGESGPGDAGGRIEDLGESAHPDDRPVVEEALRRMAMGDAPSQLEYRLIRPDGSYVWTLSRSTVIRDETGAPRRVVGVSTDITERKRAEQALRNSEERYRSIVETAHEGIWVVDAHWNTTFVNSRLCRMIGRPATDLLFRPWSAAWSATGSATSSDERPETRTPAQAGARSRGPRNSSSGDAEPVRPEHDPAGSEMRRYTAALEAGGTATFEFPFVRPGGETVWTLMACSPLLDGQGAFIGALAMVTDITQRRRMEAELREWKQRYEAASRASRTILYDRVAGGRVVWGGAVESLLGVRAEAVGGMAEFLERVHPDDREAVRARLARADATGEPMHVEYRLLRADGGYMHVEDYGLVTPETASGPERRYVGFIGDVSERIRDKNAIRLQNEALARSNRDLERFAYLASHDLQEPLRTVSSYVQLLRQRHDGALGKESDEFIGYVVDGVSRMSAMISDLLRYSRVNTAPRRLEPVESHTLATEAVANLRIAIAEVQADVSVDPALPIVQADASQVRMLFQNLIANAVKFRRPGVTPRVRIEASIVPAEGPMALASVSSGGEGAEAAEAAGTAGIYPSGLAPSAGGGVVPAPPVPMAACFSVSDNGIGIERHDQERLFQMFQRLRPRTDFPGNGIGLAICKRIVERHGGRIWIESVPGEGTTFRFTLPFEASAGAGPVGSGRLAIVDVVAPGLSRHSEAVASP